jgi:hypothetical protein
VFALNYKCVCRQPHSFRRGHEAYAFTPPLRTLSLKEKALKLRVERSLRPNSLFTDVDFLLNRGCFSRAHEVLRSVLRLLAERNAAPITLAVPVAGVG